MNRQSIHFYDAANPANVQSGVYAAVYVNGFAWPQSEIDRMAKIFKISVEREAWWAEKARCIDVETGAGQPEDVVPFMRYRAKFLRAHGFHFFDGVAYVNRSNYGDVKERCDHAKIVPYYWVATLDGTQEVDGAWAVQYETVHGYDVSVLHGVDDFRKP